MKARATVIIPTFGQAKFARWAIRSVQNQTIKDIEICIICDGSPENMISFFQNFADEDPRIRVFKYPKSPRTGEPYRDAVIKQTTGRIICYCSHDDLWLPNHLEVIEGTLKKSSFTHSIHVAINVPENIVDEDSLFAFIHWIDLQDPKIVDIMLNSENFFGLTYGAHTRKSYDSLEEGWVTTPYKDIPTDLYMWRKFLSSCKENCKTTMKITALNFPHPNRKNWSEQERDEELKLYFAKIQDRSFIKKLEELPLKNYKNVIKNMSKEIELLQNHIQNQELQIKELEKSKSLLKEQNEHINSVLDEKKKVISQLTNSIQSMKTVRKAFKLLIKCLLLKVLNRKELRGFKEWLKLKLSPKE